MNQDKLSRIKQTFDIMINNRIIPEKGLFSLNENIMQAYIEIYGDCRPKHNNKFSKNYARKMGGLEFLKLLISRGGDVKTCKEGIVYLIWNPIWPDHLKIGMTMDLNKRLLAYQTCDPFKQYKVKHYEFVLDRRKVENALLNKFNVNIENGEWIKFDDSESIIRLLRSEYHIPNQKLNHTII